MGVRKMIGTFWKNRVTGAVTVIMRSDPLNWVVLRGTKSARRESKRDFYDRYESIGKVRR